MFIVSAYLIGGGIILSLVLAGWFLAYIGGKRAERDKGLAKHAEVRDKQLEAANNAPRTTDELVKAIREKGL